MGLESANLIHELVETNPLAQDPIRDGDNHLRLVKRAIKNTFIGITEQVVATAEALNNLPDDTVGVIAALLSHLEKRGSVKAWDVANNAIPSGWVECNGQNVAGYGVVPDLRDRFVACRGPDNAPGSTTGAVAKSTNNGGGHTPTINGTALGTQHMPDSPVQLRVWNSAGSNGNHDGYDRYPNECVALFGNGGALGAATEMQSEDTANNPLAVIEGGGQTHNHTADAVASHNHSITDVRPPVYYMVWIVKVTDFVLP